MPLTDKQIKALRPYVKAKKYFDGTGFYLEVAPLLEQVASAYLLNALRRRGRTRNR